MDSIGKKEIDVALEHITIENKYDNSEIDSKILEYYNITDEETLEFLTFRSDEFHELNEVYDYVRTIIDKKKSG